MPFKKTGTLALAVPISGNKKLGAIATTYVSGVSCPDSCPFNHSQEGGCYGHRGPVQWQVNRLNKTGTPIEAAVDEAIAIANLPGDRPLRLHTFGDAKTNAAAKELAKAEKLYRSVANQPVFTYTHAWKRVSRKSWGGVSVLASCETPSDVKKAKDRGYATSMVVERFEDTKLYVKDGVRVLPCPEMTGKAASCKECKLCFDDARLREKDLTIAFSIHGADVNKAQKALRVLNG